MKLDKGDAWKVMELAWTFDKEIRQAFKHKRRTPTYYEVCLPIDKEYYQLSIFGYKGFYRYKTTMVIFTDISQDEYLDAMNEYDT